MNYVYAIKDTAVQAFGNLITMRAPGEMMRSFQDEVNSKDTSSQIARHPDDYELYLIGTFNPNTGNFQPQRDDKGNKTPTLVARAKDLLQKVN